MATFAKFVTACETAFWPERTFLAAYGDNAENAVDDVLEADVVVSTFRDFMRERGAFEGTATELVAALTEHVRKPERDAAERHRKAIADRDPDLKRAKWDIVETLRQQETETRAALGLEPLAGLFERHQPLLETIEDSRPPDVNGAHWETATRGLRAFLASGHADEALRLGWPHDELFRVPPVWARVELCGVALLIGDREVLDVTRDAIRIKTASGAIQALYRKPEPDFALIYSERRQLILQNVDPEEAHCRAYDHAVAACRAHHNCDLEAAKTMVLAATKRSA